MKPHVLVLEVSFGNSRDIAGLAAQGSPAVAPLARSAATALKIIPDHMFLAPLDIDLWDGEANPLRKIPLNAKFHSLSWLEKTQGLTPDELRQPPSLSKPAHSRIVVQPAKSLSGAFE